MSTIEKMLVSKERHRKRLAQLSVPEKVRIIVQMQERRAPILRMRGKKQIIWRLDPEPKNTDHQG